MASYIEKHDIPWPVLVDPSREFEKRCGLKSEISLQNIHQVYYISGDGQLKGGRWSDIQGTIESALKDATWRIDPRSIPASLKQAWTYVEQGNYAPAARDIQVAIRSPESDTQKAAESLLALIRKELKKEGQAAWALGKEGKHWPAYQALASVCDKFANYQVPKKLVQARDRLADMDAIKDQARAKRMLTGTKDMLESGDPRRERTARKRLQSLIKKFPDTEAAQIAHTRLNDES